jgi:Transposase DDE domain
VTRHLAGKLYADKGYIGHELFKRLWQRGLHLICKNRYSIFRTVSDQSATTALASLARPGALPSSPAPCGAPLRGSGA